MATDGSLLIDMFHKESIESQSVYNNSSVKIFIMKCVLILHETNED